MYKVFFNEYVLHFTSEFNNSSNDNIRQVAELKRISEFAKLLDQLDAGKYVEELKIQVRADEKLLKQLPVSLTQLPAAGGLVNNDRGEMLFIKRFGRWDLPKGKIEKMENAPDAAIREVEEECGIQQLQIVRQLPSTFHIYRSPFLKPGNDLVWKETSWFEMTHSGAGSICPQQEEGIEEVRWFNRHELSEVLESTYGNLKELLNFYLA